MTAPKICVCGHQQSHHAGWARQGRCNECRWAVVAEPCREFRFSRMGKR